MTIDKKEIKEKIIAVIKTVYDPEIPVDVYSLGLIYDIDIDDGANVSIKMTLTSPNCPEAEVLPGHVRDRAIMVGGVNAVEIELVWDPVWDRDMMSEAAKLQLGFF
jgi:FeS assembly SUF system protein